MLYEITKHYEINSGETWENTVKYKVIILDTGIKEIWVKFENGSRGSINVEEFISLGYTLKLPL